MSAIREIPNDRMAGLKAPEFVCDECIVNRDIEPLENKAFFMAVLGRPGSGKTSFCVSTLTSRKPRVYYKAFNHLWVFMPPASRKSLKCNPFARLRHVFDDLDYASLTEVFEAIKKQGPQADGSYETNLLLIDDFASSLKDKAISLRGPGGGQAQSARAAERQRHRAPNGRREAWSRAPIFP